MKSIRLSLLVYFLGLLAVALTVASVLVYRTAEQTLQAKKQATEQLIQAQYRERCAEEENRLDKSLLDQAQSLAHLVQVQVDWGRTDRLYAPLELPFYGLIATCPAANGYLLAPTWLAQSVRMGPGGRKGRWEPSPVFQAFHPEAVAEIRKNLVDITLKDDELLVPGDGPACDYFQIDSPTGRSYHSRSLAGRSFPAGPQTHASEQLLHGVFDDTTLPPDTRVRRVVLMVSGVEMVTVLPAPPFSPRRPGVPARREVHRRSGPTIYVQCASETGKRDAALAALRQRRDDDLAAVEAETRDSLLWLRTRLLIISAIVFAATGAGSFWLVRLGLRPLRRVSDAVSRVSARDFRLPLDERPLPGELRPIVERLTGTLGLLKRAFAREKQASADISHELRTPLAALMTTTELALRKPRSSEQYREMLQDCHTSAQQMNQIVERLLTLARLDAGVDRLRVQPVDVDALAQQCAAVVRPLAEARGLTLTVHDRGAGPANGASPAASVPLDPDKLREVLSNLLHNAIQYNRPGGVVALRVGRQNGHLEVEVRDTGIGIAPEAREHIFERFYRADPSRRSDDLHAGLGLAIVKEYVDLMGGTIGVESTEGQGSTFRVHLPVN